MPKIKTKRGAMKRFKVTASGKVKANHNFANHLLTKKSRKRKRHLRQETVLSAPDRKRALKMMGK